MTFGNKIFDLAVVGGGPAGAVCAISASKAGSKSVAIIDAQTFPRDKSCGDGLGPGAVQIMRKLGADEILKSYRRVQFLSISSPSNLHAKGPLPIVDGSRPQGYTIPRLALDDYLFKRALEYGVRDISGHRFEDAGFDGELWTLHLAETGTSKTRTIRARVLVGADGARSKVRRMLGVAMNSDRHTGTAVRMYAKNPDSKFDALQIDFMSKLLPAYGWVFPISDTEANIGIGIDLYNYKKRGDRLAKLFSEYRKELPSAIEFDEDSYSAFILPYGSQLPQISYGARQAALIGDAASMINPLTGEGVYYGMFAGELLGRLVANAQANPDGSGSVAAAMESFERQFRSKFKAHYDVNWTMKEKIKSEYWCDFVIRACTRDKKILSDLVGMMMGNKADIDPMMLVRILTRNFLPF